MNYNMDNLKIIMINERRQTERACATWHYLRKILEKETGENN